MSLNSSTLTAYELAVYERLKGRAGLMFHECNASEKRALRRLVKKGLAIEIPSGEWIPIIK